MSTFKTLSLGDWTWFRCLEKETIWEKTGRGRLGAVMVKLGKDDLIPIVRSTTKYFNPAQEFALPHAALLSQIQTIAGKELDIKLEANNLMLEIYDSSYKNMKEHSDQAWDLDEKSWIAIFSCYDSTPSTPRLLQIRSKITGEKREIKLEQNSLVLFSVQENARHYHKIVLPSSTKLSGKVKDKSKGSLEDKDSALSSPRWLGATFRLSKTFLIPGKGTNPPTFYNPSATLVSSPRTLVLATSEQFEEFIKRRGEEKRSTTLYKYPEDWWFTISKSDLLPVIKRPKASLTY